jgi:diadenylate cyclase
VSAELLVNIFIEETPLHDGAIIIRGNTVLTAACFLPLAEGPNLEAELGGRHRAGLGISEQTDALAVIVSEETGAISLANEGKLIRNLDLETLEEMLESLLKPERREGPFAFWQRGNSDDG